MPTSTNKSNNHRGDIRNGTTPLDPTHGSSGKKRLAAPLREPFWTPTIRSLAEVERAKYPVGELRDRRSVDQLTLMPYPTVIIVRESNDHLPDLASSAESWRRRLRSSPSEASAALDAARGVIANRDGGRSLLTRMTMYSRRILGYAVAKGTRA